MTNSYGDTTWLVYIGTVADAFLASGGLSGTYFYIEASRIAIDGENLSKDYHESGGYDSENKLNKTKKTLDVEGEIIKPTSGTGTTNFDSENANAVSYQLEYWWENKTDLYLMMGFYCPGRAAGTYKADLTPWYWRRRAADVRYLKCSIKRYHFETDKTKKWLVRLNITGV